MFSIAIADGGVELAESNGLSPYQSKPNKRVPLTCLRFVRRLRVCCCVGESVAGKVVPGVDAGTAAAGV